jgi:hypothetical protein
MVWGLNWVDEAGSLEYLLLVIQRKPKCFRKIIFNSHGEFRKWYDRTISRGVGQI